ncbi:MAG: PilZ domain-containing protein [Deltaproteobacteria bacterium]|jgi:hypothetical protein|nr:PilZ domain-containing protein [Deltaproteobacteria bacterium]
MKERRQFERFTIPLPVRLETMTTTRKRVFDLETRDISASGTFIPALTSFPKGTGFIMDFTIPSDNFKEFKYVKSLRGLTGTMVRSTSEGVAIHFDRECYIMSLRSS